MSESDAGGDDLSGLSGFFFYVFIVHPATAWILKPGLVSAPSPPPSVNFSLTSTSTVAAAQEIRAKEVNHICDWLLGVAGRRKNW